MFDWLVGGIPTPLKNMTSSVVFSDIPKCFWKVIQNSMFPYHQADNLIINPIINPIINHH